MIDLEARLRETMDRRAAAPLVGHMPNDTRSRVRRRRALNVVATAAVVLVLVSGLAGVLRLVTRGPAVRPAAEATVAMPSPTEAGVTYATPAPLVELAPGQWPLVQTVEVEDPYIDREVGVDVDKTVVASGLVEGTEWSLTAFAAGARTCGELFLGDLGDYGGVRFCSDVPGETGQHDLRVAGTSFGLGPLTSYAGVVTDIVDRVVFELADGSRRAAELVSAPQGIDGRSFVLFVPVDASGRIVALDRDGDRVAIEPLCVAAPAPAEQVASCGNGMAGTFSAVSGAP